MYSRRSGLVIAFHGCDKKVRDILLNSPTSWRKSENKYDWLGNGMYFWEYNAERALEFAAYKATLKNISDPITDPVVIGAIINLGNCLDLLDSHSIKSLNKGYDMLCRTMKQEGFPLPKNTPLKNGKDLIFRNLDCAVIEAVHSIKKDTPPPYDSVRGVFWEGDEVYKGAGFREQNHIQICVRNPNCIKAFFTPREIHKDQNPV